MKRLPFGLAQMKLVPGLSLILTGCFIIAGALSFVYLGFFAHSLGESNGAQIPFLADNRAIEDRRELASMFNDHVIRFAIVAATLGCLGTYFIWIGKKLYKKAVDIVVN